MFTNSHPKHTGIYSIKDGKIDNLYIKIYLRCINTLLKLPKYEIHKYVAKEPEKKKSHVTESRPTTTNDDNGNDCTIVTLKWQQKVFSRAECELYKDLKNCATEQQKKYHQILKEEERTQAVKEKKLQRKKRNRKLSKLTTTRESEHEENGETHLIFTYIQDDGYEPKEMDAISGILKEYHFTEPYEVMYVYASLNPDTQILQLTWYRDQNLLLIYPDFNNFQLDPYHIELDTDYRHLYAYGIEDASHKLVTENDDEFFYLPELSSISHWRCDDELSKIFSMPPKRTQRTTIFFTIEDIRGFENDNIHVRYRIHLPPYTILEEGLLEASTHSASENNSQKSSIHIGYAWQLTVLCEEQFDPSHCLKIYFELISIDSWLRERNEGYCHYSIRLLKPLHHNIQLQCIRPVDSFLESLNRHFIGGRRKFNYIRFVGDDKESDNGDSGVHSRYGLRMRNSGQMQLSCHILTQRNCELLNPCANRTSGMTLDDIMMAYKEARRRLEAISFK
ncbi:Meckel syndrome, type 1 [Haematobia irritans]|uniref:Meckel syndrome, type 1 n=1 Tax=Haematobia irritans TaxID=7368 RepID=UPI003F504758